MVFIFPEKAVDRVYNVSFGLRRSIVLACSLVFEFDAMVVRVRGANCTYYEAYMRQTAVTSNSTA